MKRGFTIIEILIIVAITILILALVIIPFKQMNERQALIKETANIISIINHARSMTLSSKGGEPHGVHIEANRVVLFSGPTYSSSDPDNVSIELNSQVSISNINLSGGITDVVFNQLTGTTAGYGTITLSLVASSTQAKTISINSTGIINENP
jgi:type II secretory pathway pseudopilin PulG